VRAANPALVRRATALIAVALAVAGAPSLAPAEPDCTPRLLVLSAFPGEIDMLLGAASVERVEAVDGSSGAGTFYVGTLEDNDVVLALTGIGLVNADRTTRLALEHFSCADATTIQGIVFSGVSGGPNIGDVMVPEGWTLDGVHHFAVDPAMYATAEAVASSGSVLLASDVPAGDPACVGADPRAVTTVTVTEEPRIRMGAHGASSDGFEGRTLPCFPGGGDVFGCHPCRVPLTTGAPEARRTVEHAVPFVDPNFFFNYFGASAPPPGDYVALDMETAAVAKVAEEKGVPFIAFRAASDGGGDPLGLPGFPFQFFYYRQLAADNAATVALAFLAAWAA